MVPFSTQLPAIQMCPFLVQQIINADWPQKGWLELRKAQMFRSFPRKKLDIFAAKAVKWAFENVGLKQPLPSIIHYSQKGLLDSGLSPEIFPQIPDSTLWQIVLKDPSSGKQLKIEENGADLSMLNDSGFGNFSQLAEITFRKGEGPKAKGFLHVLEAISELNKFELKMHQIPSSIRSTCTTLCPSPSFQLSFIRRRTIGFTFDE
jgi:hypothetical protein